jgi:hypothetical protein
MDSMLLTGPRWKTPLRHRGHSAAFGRNQKKLTTENTEKIKF